MSESSSLLAKLAEPATRPNPYPLYRLLRETPVAEQDDGTFAVSTYRRISSLIHDPRLSSNLNNMSTHSPDATPTEISPFITQDPPVHDDRRRVLMRQFGPPGTPDLVARQVPEIHRLVDDMLSRLAGRKEVDLVDEFAYPLPVDVICHLLGIPPEDHDEFSAWADALVASIDPNAPDAEKKKSSQGASLSVFRYISDLVQRRREEPSDDMLSRLANDPGHDSLSDRNLGIDGTLLLVAGHETTVNLIANGMLTLMRHPDILEELRTVPEMAVPLVEELLRYEPPVQFLADRCSLEDIEIDGANIPKGVRVLLMLAAGNRDPERFEDPERFDPWRRDNEHFGFGGGVHYCFGAPLARLEAQIALSSFARRVRGPRLKADPPPYRPSPVLRGPLHLVVEIEGISD
jgi:cytochrome P450